MLCVVYGTHACFTVHDLAFRFVWALLLCPLSHPQASLATPKEQLVMYAVPGYSLRCRLVLLLLPPGICSGCVTSTRVLLKLLACTSPLPSDVLCAAGQRHSAEAAPAPNPLCCVTGVSCILQVDRRPTVHVQVSATRCCVFAVDY
jgi:hypothetical protein